MYKMVNVSRYYRALESVSIASASSPNSTFARQLTVYKTIESTQVVSVYDGKLYLHVMVLLFYLHFIYVTIGMHLCSICNRCTTNVHYDDMICTYQGC